MHEDWFLFRIGLGKETKKKEKQYLRYWVGIKEGFYMESSKRGQEEVEENFRGGRHVRKLKRNKLGNIKESGN